MAVRFLIVGGGPAGNTAATYAARLGAEVTLVERDVVGGAAHLWDCIPSKAMIATGGAMSFSRRAYPPASMPSRLVVIGSGVTGVEFVHMFSSFGSEVTLIVSRQQVLPNKDPEVAAALEDEFLSRGVTLYKGARAIGAERDGDDIVVRCDDGRVARGSHALLAIGSVPNSDG